MESRTSESVVSFISNLLPLYIGEERDGVTCARSLTDGTLVVPLPGDDDHGLVEIHWQGDSDRITTVPGALLASLAISRYVEVHAVGRDKNTEPELDHLANHFTVKTGESLVFASEADSELFPLIARVTERIGAQALIELLKRAAGI